MRYLMLLLALGFGLFTAAPADAKFRAGGFRVSTPRISTPKVSRPKVTAPKVTPRYSPKPSSKPAPAPKRESDSILPWVAGAIIGAEIIDEIGDAAEEQEEGWGLWPW